MDTYQNVTLQRAEDTFLLDCQARNLRPASLNTYRRQLTQFVEFAHDAGVVDLAGVDANLLRLYITTLQARGLVAASIRTAGRVLRTWLNFCVADRFLDESPMKRVRLPKEDRTRPDAFTLDEMKRLVEAAKTQRDRAIVLCLLDTGCRVGEFAQWTIGNVDLATGAVRVRHNTKSRQERIVYLGEKARHALRLYLAGAPGADNAPLWRTKAGAPLVTHGIQRALLRLGSRAGVKPSGPHKYRRTFAVYSLRSGMDLYSLQGLMGHSSIDLLKYYIGLSDEDLATAHASFGPVDHIQGLNIAYQSAGSDMK